VNLKDSSGSESLVGDDDRAFVHGISDVLCVKCGARSVDAQAEELSPLPNLHFLCFPHEENAGSSGQR
jgi:hypothetical protein